MAPITIMGRKAYGVYIMPGMGFRNNDATGVVGTGISFSPATKFPHVSGDAVQALGSGITLDSPLAKGHRPARKSPLVQAILLQTNAERPQTAIVVPEFGAVLARYELEEMPDRDSTAASYESYIRKHIRPRWAEVPLDRITPMTVEDWLKRLALAPKTRSHIRSLMHTIFQCAQRWELVERNAIELVRIRAGASASSRHASLRRKSSSSCWP